MQIGEVDSHCAPATRERHVPHHGLPHGWHFQPGAAFDLLFAVPQLRLLSLCSCSGTACLSPNSEW